MTTVADCPLRTLTIGQFIELPIDVLRHALHTDAKRMQFNARRDGYDPKAGPQSGAVLSRSGTCAEFAFGYAMNLFPDMIIGQHPTADFRLPDGRTVDVKSTSLRDGRLLVPATKADKRCDVYVLMIGHEILFQYAGCATADEVFQDRNWDATLHKPAWALRQDQLHEL